MVLLCLEKSLEVEYVELDMSAGEHKSAAYLALNPNHRVPTLVDGNLVVYESTAILYYLEEKYPEPALLPRDLALRGLAHQWMACADNYFGQFMGTIIFPKRFLPEERWDRAAMKNAEREIAIQVDHLSRALGDADYLIGNRFGLVEVSYLPFLEFLPLLDIDVPENVDGWRDRLLSRPSARQTKPAK